jgi:hypothetical protein
MGSWSDLIHRVYRIMGNANGHFGLQDAQVRRFAPCPPLLACSRRWARFRLRSSSFGGQAALPTLRLVMCGSMRSRSHGAFLA